MKWVEFLFLLVGFNSIQVPSVGVCVWVARWLPITPITRERITKKTSEKRRAEKLLRLLSTLFTYVSFRFVCAYMLMMTACVTALYSLGLLFLYN